MARTTATNFTGVLDFSLATAPTDAFLKEDLQTMAQAVDLHDHTAGKGALLTADAIPVGSITSAMIADGAIQTSDLESGAVTSVDGTLGVVSFSTSTVGVWVPTTLAISEATSGGSVFIWFAFNATYGAGVGEYFRVGLQVDGGGVTTLQSAPNAVANQNHRVGAVHLITGLAAGAHTFTVSVFLNAAGTVAFDGGTPASMVLLEVKR